jgi:TPR repeat protein
MIKKFAALGMLAVPLLLDGCITPVIEGAQQGYDASRRVTLKNDVSGNDPVAQYQLGNTYCCQGGGPMDDLSIYDNIKATHWYCKSARQGYGPAQYQLARLYSGHPIRGLHIVLRASALVGTSETDLSLALMWANLAADKADAAEVDDAIELRDEIAGIATDKERASSALLMENWRTARCQWAEVFPRSKRTEK